MNRIRVVVLDDSMICRAQLRSFLQAEGDIEVVAEAANGENCLLLLSQTKAQLLVVDLQMPRTDGHQTISQVMAHAPIPILVVTGQPLGEGRQVVFESIRRGALDLAEKPSLSDAQAQKRLRETVRRLAMLPVVRHVSGKLAEPVAKVVRSPTIPPPRAESSPLGRSAAHLVVGIGSSAGGPLALSTLVGAWPSDFDAAVVVVQHLPASFMAAFVEFLRARTRLRVVGVSERCVLQSGSLYVAASDTHIALVERGVVAPLADAPRDGHRPSVDVLFESLARHEGPRAAGIVLSGIGQDGTAGLLALRKRGGLCLAQDQSTSAVWGMPKSAMESEAAERALPPLGLAEVTRIWTRAGRGLM